MLHDLLVSSSIFELIMCRRVAELRVGPAQQNLQLQDPTIMLY